MKHREQIIQNYIDAYNRFDIERMMRDFDESIIFENISNDTVNMRLEGLSEFKAQAEIAKNLFSGREQVIRSFNHREDETEIEIDYHAIMNADLPNGLKKGDEINLRGRSVFRFSGDKIVGLTDIS